MKRDSRTGQDRRSLAPQIARTARDLHIGRPRVVLEDSTGSLTSAAKQGKVRKVYSAVMSSPARTVTHLSVTHSGVIPGLITFVLAMSIIVGVGVFLARMEKR